MDPLSNVATSKGFRMANININSLLKLIDELRVILEKHPLDVLAINESKIDESISDYEIKIPGYVSCKNDRNRNGGGVMVYIRECISFILRSELIPNQLEMVCIEICRQYGRSFFN